MEGQYNEGGEEMGEMGMP